MVALVFLAAAAAAHQPSAEALRLGNEIAAQGTLAALLPIKEQQDVADLIAEDKALTPAEQAKLRATVRQVYAAGKKRVFAATGRVYAERLGLADLRSIATFYRSSAARRFQAAVPLAIVTTIKSVGDVDAKKEARTAFCNETGKLCAK